MTLFGFLEPARIKFEKAIDFYNQQRPTVGDEFAGEVLNTINRILNHPEAWTGFPNAQDAASPTDFPTE